MNDDRDKTAEQIVGEYITSITHNQIGYGEDPVGFLIASHAAIVHNNRELSDALRLLRSLVKEGGMPRYYVTPGAALNAVIEEVVDPVLRRYAGGLPDEEEE